MENWGFGAKNCGNSTKFAIFAPKLGIFCPKLWEFHQNWFFFPPKIGDFSSKFGFSAQIAAISTHFGGFEPRDLGQFLMILGFSSKSGEFLPNLGEFP